MLNTNKIIKHMRFSNIAIVKTIIFGIILNCLLYFGFAFIDNEIFERSFVASSVGYLCLFSTMLTFEKDKFTFLFFIEMFLRSFVAIFVLVLGFFVCISLVLSDFIGFILLGIIYSSINTFLLVRSKVAKLTLFFLLYQCTSFFLGLGMLFLLGSYHQHYYGVSTSYSFWIFSISVLLYIQKEYPKIYNIKIN